jgi:hypothetical protein
MEYKGKHEPQMKNKHDKQGVNRIRKSKKDRTQWPKEKG